MAKNGFGKIVTGVAVIGAGVALGLAIYNRLDTIKRELNDDEFEDDFEDDSDDEEDDKSSKNSYVTINSSSDSEEENISEDEDVSDNDEENSKDS